MAKKGVRKLVWVSDSGSVFLFYADQSVGDQLVKADPPSLEALADFLDQDAESNNSHSFVGAHRALAVFLHARLGRDVATELLADLAGYSGLHGMVDDAGAADDFPTLLEAAGVPGPWRDWSLKD